MHNCMDIRIFKIFPDYLKNKHCSGFLNFPTTYPIVLGTSPLYSGQLGPTNHHLTTKGLMPDIVGGLQEFGAISSLIAFLSENKVLVVSVLQNLFRFALWTNKGSLLVNIP